MAHSLAFLFAPPVPGAHGMGMTRGATQQREFADNGDGCEEIEKRRGVRRLSGW